MQKVIIEITMSVDGFTAGPEISKNNPLGKGGERLHEWIFTKKTTLDDTLSKELFARCGAVIVGSRTYTTAIEDAWGGASPFAIPAFVVSHTVPAIQKEGFTYVTEGILPALEKAKGAAGEKDVLIMGGANIIQQYIKVKMFDELNLHIVPVLFKEGTRLFDLIGSDRIELQKIKTLDTPAATHVYYEVMK